MIRGTSGPSGYMVVESIPSLYWQERTIKEANDVGEVHVIVDDDLAVELDECECYEEHQMRRAHVLSRPNRLPHREHIVIHQLCRQQNSGSSWLRSNTVVLANAKMGNSVYCNDT